MKFSIRQTKNEELIRLLHAEIFPADEFYEHKNNVYWVIKNDENNYCGFCIGTYLGYGIFFLSRAGVRRKYRGLGLHNKLIKIRERYAKTNLYSSIITYTIKDNYQSFCHLIKMRYSIYEPEWNYAGKDVFYFKKDLSYV